MLVAWAIAVQLLTSTIDRRLDEQLDNATAILANGEFPFSIDLIRRLDRLIEARIALLDAAGNIQLSTLDASDSDAIVELLRNRPDQPDGQVALISGNLGETAWRVAVRPLSTERDSRFHFVVAAASLAEPRQAAQDAAILLATAMFLATLILAWIGVYFTRSITRPVSELASMADRIADGERDISSDISANNEIGLLARALNGMASRLRQYEEELARQSHLAGLGDLAARLAHEIRNPLTAIKMQLQLLEESVEPSDANRVRTLLNEIRRMELIVETALTLGAPLVLHRSRVQPGKLVEELAELLSPGLNHRDIELQASVLSPAAINADPDRLKQALLNLINNAADELADGGSIRVDASFDEDGEYYEISVADSGRGYSPDAEDRARRKPFGLGLGLTICKEIVELHDGKLIQSESEELGGAKFTIRLHGPILNDSGQAG
jgi:signal transduction histidine kinase